MASEARADSSLEHRRTSLLEVIEEKNRALNKKTLVHRVAYIGKLKSSYDRNEVGNYNERLLKNLQNQNQTEPVTGLMLVYFNHLVHVMEASTDVIYDVVKDMKENKTAEDGYLENAKILVVSHDIPTRLFQQWSFRNIDVAAASLGYDTNETTDKVVIDLLAQLLKLGSTLAKTPKLNLKNVMDSLHDKLPDLLPQQTILHYLLETDDPDSMISIEEYLSLYEDPYDVVLESELAWPLPTRLFPYK